MTKSISTKTPVSRFIASNIFGVVRSALPGISPSYRLFSTEADVSFFPLAKLPKREIVKINTGLLRKFISRGEGSKVPLDEVLVARDTDISLKDSDKRVQILLVAQDGAIVRFGKKGIAPSRSVNPRQLLDQHIIIPPSSFGIVDVLKQVPILIEVLNPKSAFALASSPLLQLLKHEENIERYSFSEVFQLKPEDARKFSLKLQGKLFDDNSMQWFFEEMTSVVVKPTIDNKSSATIMAFEGDHDQSKTTKSHFHPGERLLLIITINKPAGVTLNFCGTDEDPEKRKDCEKRIEFPLNTVSILRFDSNVHHKFSGMFTCISFHPREGLNLIDAVTSGKMPKGFLETATVFSKSEKDEDFSIPKEEEYLPASEGEEYISASDPTPRGDLEGQSASDSESESESPSSVINPKAKLALKASALPKIKHI